jgi:bacterioferritin (cytochrome b1)
MGGIFHSLFSNPDLIQRIKKKVLSSSIPYEKVVSKLVNDLINDELLAYVSYNILINNLKIDISEHLLEHIEDESKHFKDLIDYMYNHGLESCIKICLDHEYINSLYNIKDESTTLQEIQKQEMGAIKKYRIGILIAQCNKDPELSQKLNNILLEECEHFDDFAVYLNQKREIKQ